MKTCGRILDTPKAKVSSLMFFKLMIVNEEVVIHMYYF